MEDLIWDAVPAQRKRKEEQFTFPVVSMSALQKVGAGRKFTFNKAAQELLGIVGEDRLSFGFQASTQSIFLKKATGDSGFKLTKTCTISDKRTYEFITKMLGLNNEVENNFSVEAVAEMPSVCKMVLLQTEAATENVEIEFTNRDLGEVDDINPHAEVEEIEEEAEMPEPTEIEEAVEVEGSTEEDVW